MRVSKLKEKENDFRKSLKRNDVFNSVSKKDEMTKLIIQTLDQLGLEKTSSILLEESGLVLENEGSQTMKKAILLGQWKKALGILENIKLSDEILKKCQFLIYEQNYLESLQNNDFDNAVRLLRNKLTLLIPNKNQFKNLASLLIDYSNDEYQLQDCLFNDIAARKKLFKNLQNICSSFCMLQSSKMSNLLNKSIKNQISNCNCHFKLEDDFSLLEDHRCSDVFETKIPSLCMQSLRHQKFEVSLVKFSNKGEKIVAILKNHSFLLYEFNSKNLTTKLKSMKEKSHDSGINAVAWRSDDSMFMTASSDFLLKIWNSNNGDLLHICKGHTEAVMTAVWSTLNNQIFSAGLDSQIIIWKKFKNSDSIPANKISNLLISPCVNTLIAVSASFDEKKFMQPIFLISLKSKRIFQTLTERERIISSALSKDGEFLLVNTSHKFPEIHLWSLKDLSIVQRYEGHIQSKSIVTCGFGGFNQSMITVGSEDGSICIWQKNSNKIKKIIKGHFLTTNSIDWHPTIEDILISGSDDYTLKIWVSDNLRRERNIIIEDFRKKDLKYFGDVNEIFMMADSDFNHHEVDEVD